MFEVKASSPQPGEVWYMEFWYSGLNCTLQEMPIDCRKEREVSEISWLHLAAVLSLLRMLVIEASLSATLTCTISDSFFKIGLKARAHPIH
jgi:hypothetical protein